MDLPAWETSGRLLFLRVACFSACRCEVLLPLSQPGRVGHPFVRHHPAHPRPVGRLRKVDRHAQLARQYRHTLHMVLMFVGDQQGIDGRRIFVCHAACVLAVPGRRAPHPPGCASGCWTQACCSPWSLRPAPSSASFKEHTLSGGQYKACYSGCASRGNPVRSILVKSAP